MRAGPLPPAHDFGCAHYEIHGASSRERIGLQVSLVMLMGKKLSPNMPQPRGLDFTIQGKVDADHAGDKISEF